MLSSLPVVRSPATRTLFLGTALVTVGILLAAQQLGRTGLHGMTPIFFVLFTYFDYRAASCALLILLGAALLSGRLQALSTVRWVGERPVPIAVVTTVLLCACSLLVYRNHPLAMDEYAAFFQSQVFAAGHLSGQLPAPLLDWLVPPGFQNYFLVVSRPTGHIAQSYWPSFALLLTPFTWLGIPWACNPVISGLTLVAVHRLALRIFNDVATAGLALLLTVASPVFFANGISYYSMPAHLLANTLFALLLLEPTSRRAVVAGVIGSVALTLHNPVPHILFAIPWLIWIARREGGLRLLGWLALGYLPLCVILGLGWRWFTSHLTHDGVAAASTASAENLNLIAAAFSLPSPGLLLARLIGFAKVWLWAVPGLMLLAGSGARRTRDLAGCRLLLYSAVLTFFGYLFVPFDQGHGWGFRYFHSAWVALPILAAGAVTRFSGSTDDRPTSEGEALRTFVVACALLTVVFGVGLRAFQMREFITDLMKQVPAYSGSEPRVAIIDPSKSFYGQDLVQNDPWIRGGLIRMITQGPDANALMMHRFFPNLHQVYRDQFGEVWSAADPAAHATGSR
jgi:hypothetical protein